MINRIPITNIPQFVDQTVSIAGWLHHIRKLKHISFLFLRDVSGQVQVVIEDNAIIEQIAHLHRESVLQIEGIVKAVDNAPTGFELHAPQIEVISAVSEAPTFDLFRPEIDAQLPTQLDYAVLSLRHPQRKARWEIAAAAMQGFRETLSRQNFTEIQTPKIVSSATESGANVFEIDYFGQAAYLAQSPQFYKQMMVGIYERVFEVGPVFRAEPHTTTRHLSQYTSLDAEMGFIDNHYDVMQLLTEVIRGMLTTVETRSAQALATIDYTLPTVPNEIPVLHFTEAQELYYQGTGKDERHEPDLSPEQERWLGNWAWGQHQSDFLFIIGYPMVKRPFYTHPDPERPKYSNSFDLLFRGLELVTGGQRLHLYPDYLAAIEQYNVPEEAVSGYLAAFKYGMPPHGGFAIGLERFVAQLTNTANVRLTSLFPRDMKRLTP